jgi:urease accessory protein
LIEAVEIRLKLNSDPIPTDVIVLDYEDRWVRRKVVTAAHGDKIKIDLPELRALQDRERIITKNGTHFEIIAAEEDLLEITGAALPRIAWHVGNRHTPCQVEDKRLLIKRDHVLRDMLTKLGATVREVSEPFQPEGGAYGHGRTHSHSHSHDPQEDPNAHLHSHE